MKPKDLKFPFKCEERQPQIHEGVLFIPKHYEKHRQWSLPTWEAIFGNSNPVFIEYCTGNGTWVTEKAKEKGKNWVAVEWRFDRVQKIWSKKCNRRLDNLFIVCGDAQTFIADYLRDGSVEGVYINFPDPWPKSKHAKNRLFQASFVSHLARTVKSQGFLTVVTDDPVYGLQIVETTLSHPSWSAVYALPYYVTEWEGYGSSFFDSLWREKGREIRYFQFKHERSA